MRGRATLKVLWILRTLPMRRVAFAMCTVMLLCLATASATSSSTVSKSSSKLSSKSNQKSHAPAQHKSASAAANKKNAHAASHTARSTAQSRSATGTKRSTTGARNSAHATSAVLHTGPHHRTTAAERRLARLREVNLQARRRARIETETEERSGVIEAPAAPTRRFELAEAMPSPLRGSHESLLRQNTRSDDEGLERILDEDDLNDRIAEGLLIPVPTNVSLAINGSLPENRRYCRPWTANFLTDLAHAHATEFKSPLMVTSAVRTVEYQRKLIGVNGNAAPAEGDVASPHLTGGSIDIAKAKMSKKEIAWMRRWLLPLQDAGQIDVEEEFKQACFHITVYDTYEPLPQAQPRPRARRRPVKSESASIEPPTRGE